MAARTSGLRVCPLFRPASRKPFPRAKAKPRPSTPPPTRDPKCANCGGLHSTRDCKKPLLPEEKQTSFNCGKEGHRAEDCQQPDRRKQGNGGRALTVGDGQRDVFMGVVVSDMPIPICNFPVQRPGAQASRKAAAKALIGGKAGVACNDSACRTSQNSDSIYNNNLDDINNIPPYPDIICISLLSHRGRGVIRGVLRARRF